ncbi:hypothetical protein IW261DRAFT_1556727 [Armillaria novae-zelandiae]|uniref:Uncharacterized protein n=1 Tax=Armillaria novae-zelandiae TaxID=153914 RepID=A0AA39PVZ5_9AGAR|nr:hypothetical protein IW261DRAFT_1556727 [Armillaria novae-zelandiae]
MQILLTFAGAYKRKAKIFTLRSSEGGIHAIFFVRELRFDLNLQTVAADCVLLPIPSGDEGPSAPVIVERILKITAVVDINTALREEGLDVAFLSNYQTRPQHSARVGKEKDDVSSFFKEMELDVASCFVTRAALCPLFAVAYPEVVELAFVVHSRGISKSTISTHGSTNVLGLARGPIGSGTSMTADQCELNVTAVLLP